MLRRLHRRPGVARWARRALLGSVLIGLLVVGGTAFRVWHVARADERPQADVIVVLGAAQYNGTPSKIFQARLQHAQLLYGEGVADRIVTSGAGQVGDAFTEAESGKLWLTGRGVPAEDVVAVGEGHDTLRSLQAVADLADARGWNTVVIVSDPWHSLRSRVMAEDFGLTVATSPTHSGPIVQQRQTQAWYIVRETSALLYYRLTKDPDTTAEGA